MIMTVITHLVAIGLGALFPKLVMWGLGKVKSWLATKL